jgi:hypothetical protein
MPSFRIRFLKKICDDTGHEHRICQSAIDVDAESADLAAATAQTMVTSGAGGLESRFYYDDIEVEAVVRRSRVAKRSTTGALQSG